MCARWKTILYDSSSALSEPQPTYVDTPLLAKVFEKAHVLRYIVLMIHRVVDVRGRSIVIPHAFFSLLLLHVMERLFWKPELVEV